MPFAQFQGSGDGTTRQFQIPFPYVKKDHIVVSLNQIANTNFVYINDTTIEFAALNSVATNEQETTGAPKTGIEILISRETPLLNALVDFVDGSTLTASDLDTAVLQLLYGLQEAKDDTDAGINFTPLGLDASNNPIINVQDPSNPQDATTKKYVDDNIAGFLKTDGSVPMVGDFNAGGKKLTNVETGTQDTDAVNLLQLNQGISTANTAQTAAAQSATQAEGYKDETKVFRDEAEGFKNSAAASATTAVNLARRSIFVGFKKLSDGTLQMTYNEASDTTVYKAEDFVQNGGSHAYFLGEDVLSTTAPNAPKFSISNYQMLRGHLVLDI
jgi:hypothetical protein|tara:strand:- start:6769 stop:7755 length:987 start_codon:yes stop_codon:yes gene_type:complete